MPENSSKVTLEEAAQCPKCGIIGLMVFKKRAEDDRGALCDLVVYRCMTELCSWFETGWTVQSNERGEVYERESGPGGQEKQFIKPSPDALARGRMQVEEVLRRDAEESKDLPPIPGDSGAAT